jgi:hypothetical protein
VSHERLDAAFLPVLAQAGTSLTAVRLRERCSDPWAPPLTEEWLRGAVERGLVAARRTADLPIEFTLTGKGRRAARSVSA